MAGKFQGLLMAAGVGLMLSSAAFAAPQAGTGLTTGLATEPVIEKLVNPANTGVVRGLCIGRVEKCLSTLDKASGTEMIVTFEHNSAQLSDEARLILQRIAEAINGPRMQHAKIIVEGYTDAVGPEWYNKKLSERRARTVADFLLGTGLLKERVSIVGIGEGKPRVDDIFDPTNRRVEVRIIN